MESIRPWELRFSENRLIAMAELICATAAEDWDSADRVLRKGAARGYWSLNSAEAWAVT